MERIKALDGWRAIAALGVVWIHVWTYCGNPSLLIAGFDIYKPLAIIGNGVDFFFVISGFCLYLVLYKKNIDGSVYINYIKKRWLRIAPAFYSAAFIIVFCSLASNAVLKLLVNFLFLQNAFPLLTISAPFWSLGVEFHFYILLPLFFILSNKIKIRNTLIVFFIIGLILNFIFIQDEYRYQLVTKVIHFTVGITIAWLYTSRDLKESNYHKRSFFILSILLAFVGRFLMSRQFVGDAGIWSRCFIAFAPVFLVVGFGGMLLHTIINSKTFTFLSNKIMSFLGRISYSIYLWHSFLLGLVGKIVLPELKWGSGDPIALFFIVQLILIPVSYASYLLFERFYFSKKMQ